MIKKKQRHKEKSEDLEDLPDFNLEDEESFNDETDKVSDYDFDIDKDDQTFDDFETKFGNDAKVQQIWLDADPYINNIYLSITNKELKRKKIVVDGEEEIKNYVRQISGTEPLANKLGVSQIMGWIKSIFSKDIVMGNIDRVQYDNFMYDFNVKFMKILISNRLIWEIKINDVEIIHSIVTNGASLYLTRPIGDGERRSSRNRQDLPFEDKPKSFIDRVKNKYNNKSGRI